MLFVTDMPISLRWFKDDVPISEHKGIRVNEVADYSSTLLFESLTLDHKGNYTCTASNHAGTMSHTASMIIHGKYNFTSYAFSRN